MAIGAIPVLETERLRLREQRADDFVRHAAMNADPLIMRHVGGPLLGSDEAWRRLIGCAGLWTLLGYGYWSVERKADGAYLGQVGFADFKRPMQPSIEGEPEMGWLLTSDAHGQGYASEAVAAGLGWADAALNGRDIVAIIQSANAPSIRVAEKAGFVLQEQAMLKQEPILLFRRSAAGHQAKSRVAP